MATTTFDTLKYVKQLKAAGFDEKQAEALSEAQKESLSEILNTTLATKNDINSLEKDINRVEKELLVLKWMMGVILAGVISLVLKAFFIS